MGSRLASSRSIFRTCFRRCHYSTPGHITLVVVLLPFTPNFLFFFSCLVARVAWHCLCQNGPGSENPTCGDAAGSGVSLDSQDCSNKFMTVFVSVRICPSFKVGSNSLHRLMTFLTATMWVCVETEQTTVGYVPSTLERQ